MKNPTGDHVVYRYFDHEDRVLYVGVTSQGFGRQNQHAKKSEFFKYMAGFRAVEHYATRSAALAAEKRLIQKYKPPFNQQHNSDWPGCRDAYIARQDPAFAARLADPVGAMGQDLGHRLPLEVLTSRADSAYLRADPQYYKVASRLIFTPEHPVVSDSGARIGSLGYAEGCICDIYLEEHATRRVMAALVTFRPERRGSQTWFRVESFEVAFSLPARWAVMPSEEEVA